MKTYDEDTCTICGALYALPEIEDLDTGHCLDCDLDLELDLLVQQNEEEGE